MILREYLYVDTPVVRGLLAQLDSGVIEREVTVSGDERTSRLGIKSLADHARTWGQNSSVDKSLADAVFPELEAALESEGLLTDISADIGTQATWDDGDLSNLFPPGRIVRVTGPGWLIDSRFIASMLSGFSAVYTGLTNIGMVNAENPSTEDSSQSARPGKTKSHRESRRDDYVGLPVSDGSLESSIALGKITFGDDGNSSMSGKFLRGIVQVSRGMFAPGLHLSILPDVENGGIISIRLQEGKQYLDTDPDVLFARFGVGIQEWTVVGTIGHHPLPSPDLSEFDFADDDGNVSRGKFARYVNGLGATLGNLGFSDMPQSPGFSMVPWAVYRTLGSPEPPNGS